MKTLALTVATALLALSTDAKTIEERFAAKKLTQNTWPDVKYYRSFKMNQQLYTWNGW